MEMDNEVKGEGNSYTATFWQYDSRLGRRWNVDPIFKENISSFAAFGNNPLIFVDPNGDDWYRINGELVWIAQTTGPYTHTDGKVYQSLGKGQSLYSEFAATQIQNNNVSFKVMDAIEAHDNTVFNSYHLHRVTTFHLANAENEAQYHSGSISAGNSMEEGEYLLCSPTLCGMINRLFNWEGSEKVYKTEIMGANSIISTMQDKGLTGSEKVFTAVDNNGVAVHHSKNSAVKLDAGVAEWAQSETAMNGVGFFLVATAGGYHSQLLVVDRRGDAVTFRLLDQHGNASTGSGSPFDRLQTHTAAEINEQLFKQVDQWWHNTSRASVNVVELNRD